MNAPVSTISAALALCLALLLAGCWDRVEVNDLAIVQGVALDREESGEIRLTVTIAVPGEIVPPGSTGGGPTDGAAATNTSSTARTVGEAIIRLQEKLTRRLFWAHNAIIIIGEDLARDGVQPVLDYFSRHRQPRIRTPIAIAMGKASDVLASTSPIELSVPAGLQEAARFELSPFVDVQRFLQALITEGKEPYVGLIHMATAGAGVPEPGMLQVPLESAPDKVDPAQPALYGAAVFKGDKMAGALDRETAYGLLWVEGRLKTAISVIELGDSGKMLAFELTQLKSEFEPRMENGNLVIRVRISAHHELIDNAAGVDAGDPRVIDVLEEALERKIAQDVRKAIDRAQYLGSDFLGFGASVHRKMPGLWKDIGKDWDAIFPNLDVGVDVHANVLRTGLSTRPLGKRVDEVIRFDELKAILQVE